MHKRIFLTFFVMYMLFAVSAAAFDHHGAVQSATCPICFMSISLFSSVSSAIFIPEVPAARQYVRLVENIRSFNIQIISSSVTDRGPPEPHLYRNAVTIINMMSLVPSWGNDTERAETYEVSS
jgi:hypothetical protein